MIKILRFYLQSQMIKIVFKNKKAWVNLSMWSGSKLIAREKGWMDQMVKIKIMLKENANN
jgi:hypothetical protein